MREIKAAPPFDWRLQAQKNCCDLVCVLGGAALFLLSGGAVADIPTIAGIGTVITAFFMGPQIAYFNRTIAEPMLCKK